MATEKAAGAVLILHFFFAASSLHADMLSDPTRPATPPAAKISSPVNADNRSWVLESTLVASDRRIAVINGKLVSEGELVEGARVIAIRQHDVVIRMSDKRITLRLLPDIAVEKR